MPALISQRQSEGPLAWFDSAQGRAVLGVETEAMKRVLEAMPAHPWCWLGVPGAVPPEPSGGRGVLLCRDAAQPRFAGTVRCGWSLPMANESFGAVLLQHALDDGIAPQDLLDECERILVPGGTLWLCALNPWSPYRARWMRSGLHAPVTSVWQSALRRAGFSLDTVHLQWLGPLWRVGQGDIGVGVNDWFRAGIALTVTKRVRSLIPPTPLRALRWQGAAHSRDAIGAIARRPHPLRRVPAIMRA